MKQSIPASYSGSRSRRWRAAAKSCACAAWLSLGTTALPGAQVPIPLDDFQAAPGLEVTLWASSPLLHNPANIDMDSQGRLWVAEAVNYRGFQSHKNASLWRSAGDQVVVIEDTDDDGQADRSTVFVQDEDLKAPLGIAVLGNRVLVSCSPHLILYTDVNGDLSFDPAVDRKEYFLTGFGGVDHDHGLHALVAGPDGAWYFNAGNAGPHVVTDQSGWTLRAGSSYTGGTPYNTSNTPGLESDNGRVYVGGLALRVQPDGTRLSVYAHNFRNNYEIALDSFGNMFQNDNDDQVVACRTTWLMEHANAGYASADGSRTWQADRRPGQPVPRAHWHQDDPGVLPYGDLYGAGSPTGVAVYEGRLLGGDYQGILLSAEAGRNVVWGYHLQPDGAGFQLERFSFLASVDQDDPGYQWNRREKDARKWFRPSDVVTGPDGAVYVADWFDPVVGGHQMDDRRGVGSIYRVAPQGYAGRKIPVPALDLDSLEGAFRALASPAIHTRFLGFEALVKRGDAIVAQVHQRRQQADPVLRARLIWVMAHLRPVGRERVMELLQDEDPQTRLVALRALKGVGTQLLPLIRKYELARDSSAAVRREVALALRDVALPQCEDLLVALAEGYDGRDRWYLEAWGTACDGKENAIYPMLLGRLGNLPMDWSEPFASLVWRLHPSLAADPLERRARAAALSLAARRQAMDTLAFIPEEAAAQAMLGLAKNGPGDLRDAAAWWVNFRKNNAWRPFDISLAPGHELSVQSGVQLPPQPAYVSPVIRTGQVAHIDVEITGARRLFLVVTDAGDDIGCDWADWIEPRLVQDSGPPLSLTELNWKKATTGWGEVHVNRNARNLPLRVNGRPVKTGIGTHANSVLLYELESTNWTRFLAQAGLDNGRVDLGGTDYPGGRPSVVFQVFHDGPTEEERARSRQKILLRDSASEEERLQAARALARTAEGGRRLLTLAAQDRIPEAFREAIADTLRHNPDLMVRARAPQYFPFAQEGVVPLPPLPELAKLSGDVGRGRTLFFDKAGCATCHKVGGQGGAIGPDLTHVRSKFDRLALLDSMVNPSASITFGYEGTTVELKDGDIITGFLVGAGDPLLIQDVSFGGQQAVPRDRIASVQPMTQSLMPPVGSLGLLPRDLADLVAFLENANQPAP